MFLVRSPYEAKDEIKTLPWHLREWDADRKVWWVDAAAMDDLAARLDDAGYRVRRSGGPGAVAPRAQSADWVSGAFRDCPPGGRERLRRGLMAAFHPDAGGDEETAKRINVVADGYSA